MFDKEILLKRTGILESIYKRLNSLQSGYRQNIALIGSPGAGKSSILKYLTHSVKRPQLTFAYVNLEYGDFTLFINKILGSILFGYLSEKGLIIKDDFKYLLNAGAQYLPRTCSQITAIQELTAKRNFNEAFSKTLDCAELFTMESGNKLVLIFDEFHNMLDLGLKGAFEVLGKKVMLQKSVSFILASSHIQKSSLILSEKLNLLFGNFEIIEVKTLDHQTSKNFVKSLVSPFVISEPATSFIINITNGLPLYLKLISKEFTRLLDQHSQKADIEAHLMTNALFNLMCKETGVLHEKFNNTILGLTPGPGERAGEIFSLSSQILLSIAFGKNKLSAICGYLKKSSSKIIPCLKRLTDSNIVFKNCSFLAINDPLLALWLRSVFFKRIYHFTNEQNDLRRDFYEQTRLYYESFIACLRQSFNQRVAEMFKNFENESVELGERKIRLSKFEQVSMLAFENSRFKEGIFCRNSSHDWITAVKPSSLNEGDVSEFAFECKRLKSRQLKKFLITFDDIDLNASLLAKEARINTWKLNELNQLLDFFGKHKIICTDQYENNSNI